MNIITIGNGFVADHLPYKKITEKLLSWRQDEMCIALGAEKPDVLINCIGKTGRPNIDWCEDHKSETYTSNVIIPLLIAEWCEENSVHLINVGSGCIYFGHSPNAGNIRTFEKVSPNSIDYKKDEWTWYEPGWKETDHANCESFYSKSKYACDLMLGSMKHVSTL